MSRGRGTRDSAVFVVGGFSERDIGVRDASYNWRMDIGVRDASYNWRMDIGVRDASYTVREYLG